MLSETDKLLRDPGSELVFGLVAPVGADLDALEEDLSNQLRQYGYTPSPIRLSQLLKGARDLGVELKEAGEFDRLMSFMDGGDRIREKSGSGEILALWAMASIKSKRPRESPVRRRTVVSPQSQDTFVHGNRVVRARKFRITQRARRARRGARRDARWASAS